MPQSRSLIRIAFAAALFAGSVGAAAAEDSFFGRLFGVSNDTVAPASLPGSNEWSGESGASGHPLMTREAILAAAASFRACVEGLWPEASRHGIARAAFDQHTAGLTPDLKIMDFVDSQPEFTKTFWDYLDLLVTDERIQKGRELLAQHRATFDAVERTYGVDRHILVAIWGVETRYGALAGERPVLRSLATLACVGRRQHFFRGEFLAALEIASARRRAPGALRRLLGGRLRADPVHADRVQALRGRLRRRRPPRRRRLGPRPGRLHRQHAQARRLGVRPDLGLRGRGAARVRLSPGRIPDANRRSTNGNSWASAARAASRSRDPATAPSCWRPRAPGVRAS